jgi:hypothetical protein
MHYLFSNPASDQKIEKEENIALQHMAPWPNLRSVFLKCTMIRVAHELQDSDQNHIYLYMLHQEH